MPKKILILLILLASVFDIKAQLKEIKVSPSNFQFNNLTVEDGLSQTTITTIIRDRKGYLWFGTANGLNKYDGYKFTIYYNDINDSTTISDNGVASIFEDSEGHIWIGTVMGVLNKFDRKTEIFYHYYNIPSINPLKVSEEINSAYPIPISRYNENTITSIKEDGLGNLWFSTWGKGLIRMNKKTGVMTAFTHDPVISSSISLNRILRIYIDDNNDVWVGTFGGGLNKVSIKTDQKLFGEENVSAEEVNIIQYKNIPGNINSLSDNRITALKYDKLYGLWVGTYGGELNLLSNSEMKKGSSASNFIKYNYGDLNRLFPASPIFALIKDNNNYLWIGTFGNGLYKLNPAQKTYTNFRNIPLDANSLIDDEVLSLCETAEGQLWIGTHLGKGISVLQSSLVKFNLLRRIPGYANGLNDDIIWSIYEDNEEVLWIGTYRGGLNSYNRKTGDFEFYTKRSGSNNSISGNHIRSINQDKNGNLWIGTFSNGLNIFDKKSKVFRSYFFDSTDVSSLGGNQVQSIYFDSGGEAWICTFGGGLCRTTPASSAESGLKFIRYRNNPGEVNSLSDDRVYSVIEDKKGLLWIGTFGGGVNIYNKKNNTFKRFMHDPENPESLEDNRILVIFQDSDGNIWVGSYGGGLNKFISEEKGFRKFYSRDGFNSTVVYGILEDNQKCLWISTDNGLYKLDIRNESITHFDLQDGLQSMEFSGGAYFKNKKGELFFGGVNGLNYFYPDSVRTNKNVPPIVINSVYVLNSKIKGEVPELILPYNRNFISFEFSSLDFTSPGENEYAYKLEGLDKEWNYVDSKMRIANYTDLQPGEYVFKVIGSNNDGVWNTEGASVRIVISSPFWLTWWFISLVLLTAASIIYYVASIRYKNLLAVEKLKSKLAADLHDNIGAGLTEISILSELASGEVRVKPENASGKINLISGTARELVDVLSDIVWVVNPKRDSLYDLILRLKDRYRDFISDLGISFKILNLDNIREIKLPMEVKQNLYLILKEGLTNCLRHSMCRQITLDINIRGNEIKLSLSDNGRGLDMSMFDSGNGIRNMKNRAAVINGSLNLYSVPDQGTTIEFVGRIKNNFNPLNFFKKSDK